jgi:pimeloyl-ACP methyl ester carboxylesterase
MPWHGPDGHRLYYEDTGRGDAVVLMPGWAGSTIELSQLRAALSPGLMPKGQFLEAPGAGHAVHVSHAAWLAGQLTRWLADN